MGKTQKRAAKKRAAAEAAGLVVKKAKVFDVHQLPQAKALNDAFKHNRWEETLKALRAVCATGHAPTVTMCNKAATVCGRAGEWQKALDLLQEMRAHLPSPPEEADAPPASTSRSSASSLLPPPNVVTYAAVIRYLGDSDQVAAALRLMDTMKSDGVEADTVAYNSAVNACKGDAALFADKAVELLEAAKAAAKADVITFNAAMGVLERAGRWEEACWLLEDMEGGGPSPPPNSITFCHVISACASGGQCDKALSLLASMAALGVEPTIHTHNAALNACKRTGRWRSALDLLRDMETRGPAPDAAAIRNAIFACCANPGAPKMAEALELLRKVSSPPKKDEKPATLPSSPEVLLLGHVVDALVAIPGGVCPGGSPAQLQIDLPKQRPWCVADVLALSTMLRKVKSGSFENVPADAISYNLLVRACDDAGAGDAAMEALRLLLNAAKLHLAHKDAATGGGCSVLDPIPEPEPATGPSPKAAATPDPAPARGGAAASAGAAAGGEVAGSMWLDDVEEEDEGAVGGGGAEEEEAAAKPAQEAEGAAEEAGAGAVEKAGAGTAGEAGAAGETTAAGGGNPWTQVKELIRRHDPWLPPQPAPVWEDEAALPAPSPGGFKGLLSVVFHEKGWQRRPRNVHDLNVYALPAGTIKFAPQHVVGLGGRRVDVPAVDGAFAITSVLTKRECEQIMAVGEAIGYAPDEPVSRGFGAPGDPDDLPPPERVAGCEWLVDSSVHDPIYERVRASLPQELEGGKYKLAGINPRWRLFKYQQGEVYRPHVDGSWPRTGLRDGKYVYDLDGCHRTRFTFLMYLNEGFEGGETTFYTAGTGELATLEARGVTPRAGSVLCFPHGDAVGSLVHEGSGVRRGAKYVVRTDVLYYTCPPKPESRRASRDSDGVPAAAPVGGSRRASREM